MKKGAILALAFGFTAAAGAAPTIRSVDPPQVFVDRATTIAVEGSGFEPGASVALLAAGPRLLGGTILQTAAQEATDIRVRGTHAFVASGSLLVVDVADRANPFLVRDTGILARALAIDGDRALVGGDDGVIRVVDLAAPDHPAVIAAVPLEGEIRAIEISGRWALAGGMSSSPGPRGFVATLDLSTPVPRVLARLPVDGPVRDVVVDGAKGYAAITDGGAAAVVTLGVADPGRPVVESSLPLFDSCVEGARPFAARALALDGPALFVSGEGSVLKVDRDPESSLPVGTTCRSAIFGGDLVVARPGLLATPEGLVPPRDVVTEASPSAVKLAWSLESAGEAIGFDGEIAVVAGGGWLTLFDATVGRTPPESVVPSTAGSTGRVLFDRARAYLQVAAGMEVFDLGDPARPRSVATVPRLESVSEDVGFGRVEYDPVICSNPYTTCPPTAEVFDLEDPSSPSLVAAVVDYIGAFEGRTYQRHENCSEGSGTCWDWLLVKDWRDPSSPKRYVTGFDFDVQSMTMDPRAAVLRVWGFTQTWSLRYETLDLSDPDHPTRTAGWWGGTPRTFAHGREYRTAYPGILVSDRETGGLQASIDLGGDVPSSLFADDDTLYATTNGGTWIIDVTDPNQPKVVERTRWTASGGRGRHLYAAREDGLLVVAPNPPIGAADFPAEARGTFTVPPGLRPGTYDVRVAAPGGASAFLTAGLRVCERLDLVASLDVAEPVGEPPPERSRLRWRLSLDGDPRLLDDGADRSAFLTLPELPPGLQVRFVPGDGSGRMSIDLAIAPDLRTGEVVLTGDDRAAIETFWSDVRGRDAIELPRIGARTWGDLVLETHPAATARVAARYRWEFAGGRLDAARAWGAGVDHRFVARATDHVRCAFDDEVGFGDTIRALCEEYGAGGSHTVAACAR